MLTTSADGKRPRRRVLSVLAWASLALVLLLLISALWIRLTLRASLPQLEGTAAIPGLSAPVRVERDSLGVPTIFAARRVDAARALGFLHAQDRFFQMDLLRRRAAGELAELFGKPALSLDKTVRRHRFRAAARRVLERLSASDRELLDSYAQGVESGLGSLRKPPFEYLLLRTTPVPWRPEDTLLAVYAMFLDLQDETGRREVATSVLYEALPTGLAGFIAPPGTEFDAPLLGEPFATPAVPGPEVANPRAQAEKSAALDVPGASESQRLAFGPFGEPLETPKSDIGSNSWVVAGTRTRNGAALLANDMHLSIGVPNIWYRASIDVAQEPGSPPIKCTGVTLPGTPGIIVGTNTHVAWGFTNSQIDFTDMVIVEVSEVSKDKDDAVSYKTPAGPRRFEVHQETLHVRGAPDEMLEVKDTIWGPIVGKDHRGRPLAIRWSAHDAEAVNLEIGKLEKAQTLEEALAVGPTAGTPGQNLVIAESTGRIGYTILGRVPNRVGFDGQVPESWADGTRRWDGYLDASEYPRIVDPPAGFLATANARIVSGAMLARLGDGGYAFGIRQSQIRNSLLALESKKTNARAMLDLQLDDRALLLTFWHDLLLEILSPEALKSSATREEARRLLVSWGGHASVDSAGYRIARGFRAGVSQRVFEFLTAPCRKLDSQFDFLGNFWQWEGPLRRLVSERPLHLLSPKYKSWPDLLLASLDDVLAELEKQGPRLSERTWGEANTSRIRHPLSFGVPVLGRFLDMPKEPLAGDSNVPRVVRPSYGASERLVVSPGREEEGLFHMPGGQSGHPLSPHYRDGHRAWAKGEATPFLPGKAVHTLTLVPR